MNEYAQYVNIILRAKAFAMEKHQGQKCDEKLPYVLHPMQVGHLVSLITTNKNIIAAAYLHDTLEDTDATYEEIVEIFNKEIADLVIEVTHVCLEDKSWGFPNLKSRDAILIKFADRLSNLSRMGAWSEKRKQHYINKSKFWREE